MEEKEDINILTNKLFNTIKSLNTHYSNKAEDRCYFLGDVGELFTETCVELGMLRLGIPNNQNRIPSYKLVKTDLQNRVDYILELIDRCNQTHIVPIESKNYGLYSIPKSLANTKIVEKFNDYNSRQLQLISMSMNKRVNGKDLKVYCRKHSIESLETDGQIDENTSRHMLGIQIDIATNDFMRLVKPFIDCKYKKIIEKIRRDIRDGRQTWYIATKHNKPEWYVRRIRNKMEETEDIPKPEIRRLKHKYTGKYMNMAISGSNC